MKFTKERVHRFVQNTAEHRKWVLNPDSDFVDDIVEGLNQNVNNYGYFLCPCRDTMGEKRFDQDVICPCDYSALDIAEYGHCFCGLYCSAAFVTSESAVEAIPERRPE